MSSTHPRAYTLLGILEEICGSLRSPLLSSVKFVYHSLGGFLAYCYEEDEF
jgi:hypothetical protein